LNQFVSSVYNYGVYIATVLVPGVVRWAQAAIGSVANDVRSLAGWAIQQVQRLINTIESTAAAIESWAIRSIWNPLWSGLTGALKWIAVEGTYAYYLLTHPDQLALLLGKYILASWVGLGRKYSSAIGRWLINSMLSAANDVGSILEDIIASIL
jgi:hypothetical protein